MNIAYPPTQFGSPSETVDGLVRLLQEGFENPYNTEGSVLVRIEGYPDLDFIAVFGSELTIIKPTKESEPETRMVFPLSTLERIFNEFEYLDWRSPEVIGTIDIEGDLNLAFHLGMSCVRPSNKTIEKLNSIRIDHKNRGHKELKEVIRLHKPTQHELLEVIEQSIPVIISGLEPTPPCSDWTIDRMVEKYGNSVACVRSGGQKITIRELAQQMHEFEKDSTLLNDSKRYKAYTEGAEMAHEMWDDFGPMFFDREDFTPAQLWLGSVSTKVPATPLHCDPTTGFLFQVMGRKRFELYSADQAEYLYPKKAYSYYQACWFNPNNPNYELFPKTRKANPISVILHPGEQLVQPAGWFHQVYALDSPTMSVSYFWRY